ncbi:sugar phosphate nucleotidyltransferase [Candidatus Aenigmatarchaeota archaeon]
MTLKRVTITVKHDILKKIDNMVDKGHIRNRSHAIENLVLKSIHKTDIDTAVIMAGGDASGLRPFTYEIPKSLIPIQGKPILLHQIKFLKKYNIDNIIITIGDGYEKTKEYFGDGSKFGVNIEYLVENKPLGTVGALRLLKNRIKGSFLFLNVDTLMNPDVQESITFHKKQNSVVTVFLVTEGNPSKFGVARMRGNDILEFVEKPPKGKAPSNLINAGFCIMESDVFKYIPKRKYMIEELFNRLSSVHKLSGFLHDGQIFDVGTSEGYERAIKNWKSIK